MQRCLEPFGRRIEPAHHAAQFTDEPRAHLGGIVDGQPVGDRLHAVAQFAECHQQVLERNIEPLAPDVVRGERIGEPQNRSVGLLTIEAPREPPEQLICPAARGDERIEHAAGQQVTARRGHQVLARSQLGGESRQEPTAIALEPAEQPLHAEHADLSAEMLCSDVFEMVRFVEHQPPIRREHGRFLPVV